MTKQPKCSKELATLVTLLAEGYRQTISEVTLLAYGMALSDVPIDDVTTAVQQSLRTKKFMPTPAELRELCGVTSIADRAVLAWGILEKTPMTAWQAVDFDDGVINAAIRQLGGLQAFLDRWTNGESVKWLRKEFIEAYQALARTGVDGDMVRPLMGLASSGRVERITTGLPALPGVAQRKTAIEAPRSSGVVDQKRLAAKRVQ